MTTVIRSQMYDDVVRQLTYCPVLNAMAESLPPGTQMESWEFMMAANREYARRGGPVQNRHIGAVAEALLLVIR